MIQLKTILLPTDGSECSAKAATYALSFAKQYGARIVALHVVDQRWEEQFRAVLTEMGQEMTQKVRAGHEAEGRRIVEEVTGAAAQAGIPAEARIAGGIPHEEILRVGREVAADVIIMGTHGRTGMSHLFLGSVTEKVIRRAPCPVLTVRPQEHDFVTP